MDEDAPGLKVEIVSFLEDKITELFDYYFAIKSIESFAFYHLLFLPEFANQPAYADVISRFSKKQLDSSLRRIANDLCKYGLAFCFESDGSQQIVISAAVTILLMMKIFMNCL